jgi:hypothetical protein
MASMSTRNCACCGAVFEARTADVKRGWARFCSKSCKARKQEARTGQHAAFLERQSEEHDDWMGHPMMSGYFGHGQN